MISKIKVGTSAGGALKYDIEKNKAEILYKNNIYCETAEEMGAEFRAVSDQRSMKNNTFHISLSLDKEKATGDQWKLAADTYLIEMGFDLTKAQYVVTRHSDAKHDHIHITANRVQLDGSVISNEYSRYRSVEATRAAELASGLTPYQKTQEMGKDGKMAQLRSTIKTALSNSNSYDNFKTNLQKNGIELVENKSITTGYVSGISYKTLDTGQTWKGSSLGKEYTYRSISKSFESVLTQTETQAYSTQAVGVGGGISLGGSSNLSKNLTKGREGLGLTAGQKDRIRKESSHEL